MPKISSKAVVANPSGLAEDVEVGPFSFLGPEVTVAAGTVIANNVTILGRTSIGAGCKLYPGCVVGSPPEGLAAEDAGVCLIDAGNVIREHVIVEAGGDANGAGTNVGKANMLMVGCHVGHDAALDSEGIFANFTRISHHCRIEQYVRTGGFTGMAAYATVGAYAFTTGYASIDRDVPPYAKVQGIPFRVRSVNVVRLQRCGFDAGTIAALKKAFRALFDGDAAFPAGEKLDSVQASSGDEHVTYLVESLRRSAASPSGLRLQSGPES